MRNFLKRNKFLIISFTLIVILIFSYIYTVSAYTYENLDFKYGKVQTKSSLNIRCGPGTNYNKVGKLSNGDYINVFAKVGDWYIIQTLENLVGAVSSQYIEPVYSEEEFEEYLETKTLENVETSETLDTIGSENQTSEYIDNIELTQEETEFLNLINENRKNNGLSELKIDNEIQNVARLKAQDLVRNEYFSHKSPSYGTINDMLKSFNIQFTKVQENIAGNQNLKGAVETWMNSESHKTNILNSEFEFTGVAIAESSTYGKIFVEVFVKK